MARSSHGRLPSCSVTAASPIKCTWQSPGPGGAHPDELQLEELSQVREVAHDAEQRGDDVHGAVAQLAQTLHAAESISVPWGVKVSPELATQLAQHRDATEEHPIFDVCCLEQASKHDAMGCDRLMQRMAGQLQWPPIPHDVFHQTLLSAHLQALPGLIQRRGLAVAHDLRHEQRMRLVAHLAHKEAAVA